MNPYFRAPTNTYAPSLWGSRGRSNIRLMKLYPPAVLAPAFCLTPTALRAEPPGGIRELARDILRELVEIDTTDEAGSTTKAAEALAARLRAAGFPENDVIVLTPEPRHGNLVAR